MRTPKEKGLSFRTDPRHSKLRWGLPSATGYPRVLVLQAPREDLWILGPRIMGPKSCSTNRNLAETMPTPRAHTHRHTPLYHSSKLEAPQKSRIDSSKLTWKCRGAPYKTTIRHIGPSTSFHVNEEAPRAPSKSWLNNPLNICASTPAQFLGTNFCEARARRRDRVSAADGLPDVDACFSCPI